MNKQEYRVRPLKVEVFYNHGYEGLKKAIKDGRDLGYNFYVAGDKVMLSLANNTSIYIPDEWYLVKYMDKYSVFSKEDFEKWFMEEVNFEEEINTEESKSFMQKIRNIVSK